MPRKWATERRMLGIVLRDKKKSCVEDVLAQIKQRTWAWASHVMHMRQPIDHLFNGVAAN